MFRKAFLFGGMLLLVTASFVVAPGFAQARGGGGHGGGGHGGGGHGGAHFGGAHFGSNHGGYYHDGGHYGAYHYGYHPYYGSYGYYPYYYGTYPYVGYQAGYSNDYGDAAPYYADTVTSFYSPATIATQPDASAQLTIKVPADAQVWIDDTRTTSTGTVRQFDSPPLTSGKQYSYEIRARWKENGQEVTQTQDVAISAGAHVEVDFPKASKTSEEAPAPQAR